MNVLYLAISSLPHMSKHTISLDLLREFKRRGHKVYAVSGLEKKANRETYLAEEDGCSILRVKIGDNKKANLIRKGLTTLRLPQYFISAIKKYFSNVKFDLVLYPTPPVTHYKTVKYIKKRDGAKTYLLLKDIFPQNAVDIGMMTKRGIKGIIYKHFRKIEKKLYAISDNIGCMSQANVDYILAHNPELNKNKIEICPNSLEYEDKSVNSEQRFALRDKYDIPLDKKVFVYGGNLGKPQGIPFLLDCLKAEKDNKEVFFLIVGDGTEFNKIKSFIEENKLENTRLMSKLPREDYDRMVAACDVGMIFLDKRFSIPNYPSRLLSYMMAGVPILACTDVNSDVGKTVVDGGFGWWCESKNPEEFSKLVEQACTADTTDMKQKMKEYFLANFTTEKSCEIILKHF